MNNDDIYNLLAQQVNKYNEIGNSIPNKENSSFTLEKRSIERVMREIEWSRLSDEEKQQKRKGIINMFKRWDSESSSPKKEHYEDIVVSFYDKIIDVLNKIEVKQAEDPFLMRLYSVLIAEQFQINKVKDPIGIKHVPLEAINGLLEQHKEHPFFQELELNKLQEEYNKIWQLRSEAITI